MEMNLLLRFEHDILRFSPASLTRWCVIEGPFPFLSGKHFLEVCSYFSMLG